MYRIALVFEKELEQGSRFSFAFRYFETLVVIFLYREWSFRKRSENSVSKVELGKMLAIIKADQRTHFERKEPFVPGRFSSTYTVIFVRFPLGQNRILDPTKLNKNREWPHTFMFNSSRTTIS